MPRVKMIVWEEVDVKKMRNVIAMMDSLERIAEIGSKLT
jgi:hypothetical protein